MRSIDEKKIDNIMFVAQNLSRVPSVSPEETTNLVSHAERLNKLEMQIKHILDVSQASQPEMKKSDVPTYSNVVANTTPEGSTMAQQQQHPQQQKPGSAAAKPIVIPDGEAQPLQPESTATGNTVLDKQSKGKGFPSDGGIKFQPKPNPVQTQDSSGSFQDPSPSLAKKWGHQRSAPVYGTRQDSRITGGKSFVDLFVFKVCKTTDEAKIKEYLTDEDVTTESVEQASDDEVSRYRSFHVVIPRSEVDKVMDAEFWPFGVGCRFWTPKKNKRLNGEQDWSHRNRRSGSGFNRK